MPDDYEGHRLNLLDGSEAYITIIPDSSENLEFLNPEEAHALSEAEIQIKEGCAYEYHLEGYLLSEDYGVVKRSGVHKFSGRIIPGNYVGTLNIDILTSTGEDKFGVLKLEVRSRKMEYRKHYQDMLRDIADRCNELIMKSNTPIEQLVGPVFSGESKTLYQRFAFLHSILDSQDFQDAVLRVISSPVSSWQTVETQRDIRNLRRIDRSILRQIASNSKREPLPQDHPLFPILPTLPTHATGNRKIPSTDTPENRFVKHALNTFLAICSTLKARAEDDHPLSAQAGVLADRIDQWLGSSLFREIGMPDTIPLSSPILQRKEGYREILRVWLMYDLASRITWTGGEDVYRSGKKDVAVLYEYWVFFRLLSIVSDVFRVQPRDISTLISLDKNELNLTLRQGVHKAIKGIYEAKERIMNIELSYNRTFSGSSEYPKGGSWTKGFRPDYTLSIWPYGLDDVQGKKIAEQEETIVHIHFDAKYRVKDIAELLGEDPEDGKPLPQNPKDTDLMKMHAYRDAIRRTGGAYVIYPGNKDMKKQGFHEIIPGLGAFPLNPANSEEQASAIGDFLSEVADHVMNRTSQREKMAWNAYSTYKEPPKPPLYAKLPETIGSNRDLIPEEVFVLVCYYRSGKQLKWIENNKLYNARAQGEDALNKLNPEITGAKYILLHSKPTSPQLIFPLKPGGPFLCSKQDLKNAGYPTEPTADNYLMYQIQDTEPIPEFKGIKFKISELGNDTHWRGKYKPFTVSLSILMSKAEKFS